MSVGCFHNPTIMCKECAAARQFMESWERNRPHIEAEIGQMVKESNPFNKQGILCRAS